MKTYSARPSHVYAQWHVFDATDKTLGRLATEIAVLLQGKHKPMYTRHILTGDYVIVVNAGKVKVTGKKPQQKMYRRHSDYPGALRETPLSVLQERYPDRIIRAAVEGMLPKNIRGRQMLRRLKIYAGETHPHEAQVNQPAERKPVARRQRPRATQVVVEPEAPEEQAVDETTTEATEAEVVEETTSDEVESEAEAVVEAEEVQEEQVEAEVSEQAEDTVEEQSAEAPEEETSKEKAGD